MKSILRIMNTRIMQNGAEHTRPEGLKPLTEDDCQGLNTSP